jgi:hypothetical protein
VWLLRIAITNDGPTPLDPFPVLNLLVPTMWRVFRPCDENGNPILLGNIIPADEQLETVDGQAVAAHQWMYAPGGGLPANVASLFTSRSPAPNRGST